MLYKHDKITYYWLLLKVKIFYWNAVNILNSCTHASTNDIILEPNQWTSFNDTGISTLNLSINLTNLKNIIIPYYTNEHTYICSINARSLNLFKDQPS